MKINSQVSKKYTNIAINNLYSKFPHFSAKNLYLENISKMFYFLLLVLFLNLLFNANYTLSIIFVVCNILLISSMLFKIILTIIGSCLLNKSDEKINSDIEFPLYSILVPLYKENKIIKQLINALENINYPNDKIEILLLIEEDDRITIEEIDKINLSNKFKIISIPSSCPRTKPKACNYGLCFARGKYVTVYDAEDIPDKLQLKKVVTKFYNLPENYICIQAKLNYFNRKENFLSKLFSIEYSNWFEYMLPALNYMNMLIPLGGTSNHFKREKLLEIGGWDPYNVTEDAELGIRLKLLGYDTALINSTTLEESPIEIRNWLIQRTRWIKGYLQTFIIAVANSKLYLSKLSFWQIIGFYLFIGAPAISYVINPIIIIIFILNVSHLIPVDLIFLSKITLSLGIIISVIITIFSITLHKWDKMFLTLFIFPFYWLLHSLATYRAIYQLFKKNYFWEKTEHGITKYTIM